MFKYGLILWTISCVSSGPVLVQLTGKQIMRGKVMGSGYSLPAKSLLQCMDACNEHTGTCDGIVYHENIGKCRMINKCAAAIQVDNSSAAVYFSKRPISTSTLPLRAAPTTSVRTDGYLHIPENDSCVGLVPISADYADGEKSCEQIGARLVSVKTQRANKAASNILRRAELSWAWIAENNTGNTVSTGDAFSPTILERERGPGRGCWAINYSGEWRQFPCKNYKLPSLCEVLPFPS